MSNRPKGYGLTAELNRKKEAKFDPELSSECFEWMKAVFEEAEDVETCDSLPDRIEKASDVHKVLKNGVVLCKLINIIKPGSVKKINQSTQAFKEMENTNMFLRACDALGCAKLDLFQTVDLYESNNIAQVINGIIALGRKAQSSGYNGPVLGPAESVENKREFSEEQLRAGEGIIGLQAGSNKGASQAGQNFGKTRAIID